jgi:hypothetical protein
MLVLLFAIAYLCLRFAGKPRPWRSSELQFYYGVRTIMTESETSRSSHSGKTRAKNRRRKPRPSHAELPGWEELETSLRGLRNLNAMQLELIANVERIGKRLRRKRG